MKVNCVVQINQSVLKNARFKRKSRQKASSRVEGHIRAVKVQVIFESGQSFIVASVTSWNHKQLSASSVFFGIFATR